MNMGVDELCISIAETLVRVEGVSFKLNPRSFSTEVYGSPIDWTFQEDWHAERRSDE